MENWNMSFSSITSISPILLLKSSQTIRNSSLMGTRFLFFATVSLPLCFMASINFDKAMAAILNISTDQSSLLAFKDHITYHEILAKNWSISSPVCTWVGVTCGSSHHRVTALNLSYLGLVGTISPHLGNLSFLTKLDLVNNSFQGSLPNELARLRRLKLFHLLSNNLSGEIPPWVASFPKLEDLALGYNSFTGIIPSTLFNITTLQSLHLSHNKLSGFLPHNIFMAPNLQLLAIEENKISGSIPPVILNNSSLQIIAFTDNHLSGDLPQNIFRHLPNLEELYLSWNNLTGELSLMSLFNCKQLQVLSLSVSNFTGNIPAKIGNLTMLRELYLGENSLQGIIPNEIGNLQNLELLSIGSANLSGYIPVEIFNISTINEIDLVGNQLSGSLPSSLGSTLPNLNVLFLAKNDLTGKFPSFLSNATVLTNLELSYNSFSGNIPDIFGNLRNLELLSLASNNLTVDHCYSELSIIDSLTGCKYLKSLELSNNPFNSILPTSIGNLSSSLSYLGVGDCNMRGSIPSSIGNLSRLTYLGLDGNHLTGTIPTGTGKLQELERVYLFDNKLKGLVPHELCQLKSLGILSLSINGFYGPIPSCLGNVTSLRYLDLASNTFNLTIPSNLWSLSDLLSLDLSSNELRGTLPSEISNLKVMIALLLDNNQFSGNIPSSIGGLKDLTNFSLSQNEFDGPIPESFGELLSLEYLDLSKNNLTGVIPKSLEALGYLRYFNVSFNKLEGQIPSGGPFAKLSSQSFMGNELLCGAPLFGFPKCKAATSGKISKTTAIVLKYILPVSTAIVIILIIIYVSIKCKKQDKLPKLEVGLATWRRISQNELQQATNGFNDVNLLGMGCFGKVYKGILSDGLSIAVKVFNLELEGAFKSFDAECEVLCNVRHRNLTKIISSCSNIDFKALVLNYMSNGSLEKWLHSHDHCLTLIQRLNIMIDVAEALDYLHHGSSIPIVHCDIKPSNVLLDDDMVAHVTDFGIAKLLGEGDSIIQTMTLATIGYMAPEYGLEGNVSTRGDVYSYGILLVETFTQKKPTDEMFQGEYNIMHWVKESYPNSVIDILDATLLNNGQFAKEKSCLTSIMGLALDCSAESPHERTNIKDVIVALKKIKAKFLNETRNASV